MEISNLKLHGIIEKLRMRLDDDCDEEGDLLLSIAEELLSLRRENRWIPIESVKLGEMVQLWGYGWRHVWCGQVTDKDTGECVLDSPTPEHPVLRHYAAYWKPLPKAPEQS